MGSAKVQHRRVFAPAAKRLQRLRKQCFFGQQPAKKRHARAKLQAVHRAQNVLQRLAPVLQQGPRAFTQPLAQHRVARIGQRFLCVH